MLHHRQPVAHMPDNGQIVADHHIGQAMFRPQIGQQVQDLGLNADIQGAGRFVQQQQARFGRQRAGDGHTLTLPARQLVRIAEAEAASQSHILQQPGDAGVDIVHALQLQRLGQHRIDRMARMQAGIGILKDHLDGLVKGAAAAGSGDGLPVHLDAARPGVDQSRNGAQDRRFAAARFADQTEAFAAGHGEGGVLDRVHTVGRKAEPDIQIVDRQHGGTGAGRDIAPQHPRRIFPDRSRTMSQASGKFGFKAFGDRIAVAPRVLALQHRQAFDRRIEARPRAKRRAAGEVVVFLPEGMRKSFFDSDAVSYLCCLAYMTFDEKKFLRNHLLQCREDAQRETYEQTEEDFRQLFFEKFNEGACAKDLVRLVRAENRGVKDSIHPEDLMNIVSVVPRKLDVRISSQSGEFLIFGLFNPEREMSESTTRDPEPTRHFLQGFERYEIYISPKYKASIIRDLNALGVSHETLFPSLEGTAKRIKEGRV